MARSENQGLQIAVIIFAFLTIALSVATFYFFNDASTQFADAVAEKQKAQEKDTALRTQLDKSNAFLETIGQPPDATVDSVRAKLAELAVLFNGLQLPQNGKNYVNIVQAMKAWCDQANQERQDQKKKIAELEQQLKAVEAKYDDEVKKTAAKYDGDAKRLQTEVGALTGKDAERENKVKEITAKLAKAEADVVKATEDKAKELAAMEKKIAKVEEEMKIVIKERYEGLNWVFERPDATVVAVNPKEQTVNIDVGRADHLRLNIQFAVFQRGETNVYKRTKKGTITITQFIGDSMAQARVIDADLKNPILEGDVVFTPTWTPGTQETFVLAGDFDINNDRKPDNDLMRTLVDINGGKIQEEVGIDTRYLLKGDAPPPSDAENRKKYDERKKRAEDLGVKVMGLQEFIEYTGSREMINALQKQGSKEETNKILEQGKRTLGKSGFRNREAVEGGARRFEPGGSASPSSAAGGNDAARKQPPRRISGSK